MTEALIDVALPSAQRIMAEQVATCKDALPASISTLDQLSGRTGFQMKVSGPFSCLRFPATGALHCARRKSAYIMGA
jgi:hypothetical protein